MVFIVSEFVLWILLLYRVELVQLLRQEIGRLSLEPCKKKSMMTMVVIPLTFFSRGMLSDFSCDSYSCLTFVVDALPLIRNFFLSHH